MYYHIRKLAQTWAADFDQIPAERKRLLEKIAVFIQVRYENGQPIRLVFICTHNSRRSHYGQIAAAVAAAYYAIDGVETYSGGTEATAFHPNAMNALRSMGFSLTSDEPQSTNPRWTVSFGQRDHTLCFSKTFDDPANPREDFAAIMTCSDAEQNCPYVPGTALRVGTTFDDPKASDGTPAQDETYRNRFRQIATEILYAFSCVR